METRLPEEGYTRYSYSDTPRGELVKMYHELQDENQRLRGLLRTMIVNTEYCPICRYILLEGDGPHAEDCEVAKELSDG